MDNKYRHEARRGVGDMGGLKARFSSRRHAVVTPRLHRVVRIEWRHVSAEVPSLAAWGQREFQTQQGMQNCCEWSAPAGGANEPARRSSWVWAVPWEHRPSFFGRAPLPLPCPQAEGARLLP